MDKTHIIFEITPEAKHAFKMHCLTRGVTMKDALTEAVDRMVSGEVGRLALATRRLMLAPSDDAADCIEIDGWHLTPLQIARRDVLSALKPFEAASDD